MMAGERGLSRTLAPCPSPRPSPRERGEGDCASLLALPPPQAVIPTKVGISGEGAGKEPHEIPAFAGMTVEAEIPVNYLLTI